MFNIWVQLYIYVLNVYYTLMIFLYIYYKFMIFCQIVRYMGWAQICDQTARAGNWQKWKFQTSFIVNLYHQSFSKRTISDFLVCQIHWNNSEQVWNLGFHRKPEEKQVSFFSHKLAPFQSDAPLQVRQHKGEKNWGTQFQERLITKMQDTIMPSYTDVAP